MSLEIRRVQSQEEYWGVESIQREAWGFPDIGIVPERLLVRGHQRPGWQIADQATINLLPDAGDVGPGDGGLFDIQGFCGGDPSGPGFIGQCSGADNRKVE